MEKQEAPTISLSSAEAEYRALRKTISKVSWLVWLLGDLGLPIESPVPIHCDSQASLHIAKNLIFHERTKHIEIDCHYLRECLNSGLISLHFVPSSAQLTDIMTKALPRQPYYGILHKLGVFLPSSLRGEGVLTRPNRPNTSNSCTTQQCQQSSPSSQSYVHSFYQFFYFIYFYFWDFKYIDVFWKWVIRTF